MAISANNAPTGIMLIKPPKGETRTPPKRYGMVYERLNVTTYTARNPKFPIRPPEKFRHLEEEPRQQGEYGNAFQNTPRRRLKKNGNYIATRG